MSQNLDVVLSNLGFKMYMSDVGVAPKAEDRLVGIKSISGFGVSVSSADATELDGDGYSKTIALLKSLKPITLVFNLRDENTYTRLRGQALDVGTSDTAYYKDFTFVYPKRSDWTTPIDFAITAYVAEFNPGDVNTGSVQEFSVVIQGQSKPKRATAPTEASTEATI